jgi:FtsZ-interacting cell division protein ZipA
MLDNVMTWIAAIIAFVLGSWGLLQKRKASKAAKQLEETTKKLDRQQVARVIAETANEIKDSLATSQRENAQSARKDEAKIEEIAQKEDPDAQAQETVDMANALTDRFNAHNNRLRDKRP